MYRKRNLFFISGLLLIALAVSMGLIGRKIQMTANNMHRMLIGESSKYHSDLIAQDFRKTVDLANTVRNYIELSRFQPAELQKLFCELVHLDRKVTRIWYKNSDQHFVCMDTTGVVDRDAVFDTTLEKLTEEPGEKRKSGLYYCDGILYWTIFARCGDMVFGLDVSLPGLHNYFASMNPHVKSYTYVLNGEGILIVHPDENRIGHNLKEKESPGEYQEVLRNNKVVMRPGFSEYLSLPVKRIYYPITVAHEKWVVVDNIPDLIIREDLRDFQYYTLEIVLLTVLLFGMLLFFSQYKWRKEYDRRRKLEQETLALNLRQLKNQVNPHFLFNSLNSLSVLIGKEPALAREFVLRLSKIYRYVLDKRDESLVSVREEVEFIRHYYFLQRIRFGEQLRLEIEEQLEGENRKIPAMSLQMLIENAIKHNQITPQHVLWIRIYEGVEGLIIENTYTPRSDAAPDSFGIGFENISRIYEFCSDKRFSYRIEGDKFCCILPLLE